MISQQYNNDINNKDILINDLNNNSNFFYKNKWSKESCKVSNNYVNEFSGKSYKKNSTKRDKISIKDIIFNTRDAVVSITSYRKNGEDQKIITGNGFFIKNHYIICPSSLIITPSKSLSADENITINRVFITVSNVNGGDKSYSYEASILGLDGAANIAILYIDNSLKRNRCNPYIRKCHTILTWGKSRNSCPGDKIIVIGDISSNDTIGFTNISIDSTCENGIIIGNIADNRYISYGGSIPGELLLLSNINLSNKKEGLPVINRHGAVIGMIINNNVAISEYFMRRPVKALIRTFMNNPVSKNNDNSCTSNYSEAYDNRKHVSFNNEHIDDQKIINHGKNYEKFIELVVDPINSEAYYKYKKSCLGLAGIAINQSHFFSSSIDFQYTEIIGYKILAISGDNSSKISNDEKYSLITCSMISPLCGIISVGDIITHINDFPLGDRKGQIAPALLMWRIRPGDKINVKYRKENECFSLCNEVNVFTYCYESLVDFPWYSNVFDKSKDILPILV